MDELLKKLLAAEVLTEDTRVELETAIKKQIDEASKKARADAEAAVTAELNEQWITERETLIEALDSKVSEVLAEELAELRHDIENFRDLEAEYAERIVEAKNDMAATLKSDMVELIEKLDSFLEIRLTSELDELREDIDVVKKNEFGRKVFESFIEEFKKHYAGDDSTESKLYETEQRLDDTLVALEEAEKKAAKLERSIKMEKVLAPLNGRTKEVMEAILRKVDTNLLEDAYQTYIGRVLNETKESDVKKTSEKEEKVLAEGKGSKTIEGVVKKGNDDSRLIEEAVISEKDISAHSSGISESDKQRLRRIAGIA